MLISYIHFIFHNPFSIFLSLSFSLSPFPFYHLDFLVAPEIQLFSNCSILSDMFSLGLVMCSIFNQGHALIQANNSASTYLKQLEAVSNILNACSTVTFSTHTSMLYANLLQILFFLFLSSLR